MNGHDHFDPDDRAPDDDDVGVEDTDGPDELDGLLGDQLRLLLGPSDGLDRRTACDVDNELRARSPLAAAFELFGVGWRTAEALLTDRPLAEGPLTGHTLGADGDVEGR